MIFKLLQELQRELVKARADLNQTQAEAAALRLVLEDDERGLPLTVAALERREQALAGDAGRAIADRVPLWRELETLVRSLSGGVIPVGCLIDVVLRKLAALDARRGAK